MTAQHDGVVIQWRDLGGNCGGGDEYRALQDALIRRPEAGDIVPGSGGVRKLRWRAAGRGKRGGYRVIYYVKMKQGLIWILTMCPKNVSENIPAHVLRQTRKEVEDG